jgi:DNA repair protein RAD50
VTQTIIECLKYITTGVLPPSAKVEKSFVMDPSIAGTPEVKGEIRLRFKTAKGKTVIVKKVIEVSKTAKGLSSKTVEQALKTKDEKGDEIEVNQRCADIEKQIPEMLGISKAILDNIVFCHQD